MSEYKVSETKTDHGTVYRFRGPGVHHHFHTNGVRMLTADDADAVARLLSLAYEAGRRAKADQIRMVLGCER